MLNYHKAEGAALSVIETFMAHRTTALQARKDWLYTQFPQGHDKNIEVYTQGPDLLGVVFPKGTTVPPGWKQKKNTRHHHPDQTAAGHELSKVMKTLTVPDGYDLTKALGFSRTGQFFDPRSGAIAHCTLERLGEVWIVGVPQGARPMGEGTPVEGLQPMKQSEYWLLKEALEEAKAKKED